MPCLFKLKRIQVAPPNLKTGAGIGRGQCEIYTINKCRQTGRPSPHLCSVNLCVTWSRRNVHSTLSFVGSKRLACFHTPQDSPYSWTTSHHGRCPPVYSILTFLCSFFRTCLSSSFQKASSCSCFLRVSAAAFTSALRARATEDLVFSPWNFFGIPPEGALLLGARAENQAMWHNRHRLDLTLQQLIIYIYKKKKVLCDPIKLESFDFYLLLYHHQRSSLQHTEKRSLSEGMQSS